MNTRSVAAWHRPRRALGSGRHAPTSAKSRLLADPATQDWHKFAMEWKEHVAWHSPILATVVAFVVVYYGTTLIRHQRVRQAAMTLFLLAFAFAGISGAFGALITKAAAVRSSARARREEPWPSFFAASGIVIAASAGAERPSPATIANIKDAMGGEAFAHAKYLEYARHARAAGQPDVAALFDRTAREERQAHFTEEAGLAGTVRSDAENLRDAIGGEAYEVDAMYRTYAEQAAAAGEIELARRLDEIRADEASHRDAYRAALDALTSGKGDRAVPEGPMPKPADRSAVSASAESKQNLLAALRGEAFAHAKYLLYADQAGRSGHPRLARLFARTAVVEREEHFAEEASATGLVGTVQDNLRDAVGGESYEAETMYPQFAAQAEAAGDNEAADRFREIARDESRHRDLFSLALRRSEAAT